MFANTLQTKSPEEKNVGSNMTINCNCYVLKWILRYYAELLKWLEYKSANATVYFSTKIFSVQKLLSKCTHNQPTVVTGPLKWLVNITVQYCNTESASINSVTWGGILHNIAIFVTVLESGRARRTVRGRLCLHHTRTQRLLLCVCLSHSTQF